MCPASSTRRVRSLLIAFVLLAAPSVSTAQITPLPIIGEREILGRLTVCFSMYCDNIVKALQGDTAVQSTGGGIEILTRILPDVWMGTQQLLNPDVAHLPEPMKPWTYHDIGGKIALDGPVLMASGGSSLHPNAIYVYTRSGYGWSHFQTIDLPKPDNYVRVTVVDITLRENTAVVLVRYHNSVLAYKQMHWYTRAAGQPFVYQGLITPARGNRVGLVKTSTLVMLDPQADAGRGAAYTFERVGSRWVQDQKLTGSGTAPGDGFGESFAFDDNFIVISAPDQPHPTDARLAGAVYTYARYRSPWTEREILFHGPVGPDFQDPMRFGEKISLSGSRLLVDLGLPITPASPVVLYERSNSRWQPRAGLGCLAIKSVIVGGDAAFVSRYDYSKPDSELVAYQLPPLGVPPPPANTFCE